MKKWLLALGGLLVSCVTMAQGMQAELAQFEPFVGHTYRGEFAPDDKGNVAIDVSRWERILDGRAIRISHSLNDGDYAGESLIFWDAKAQSIGFFYVTNAGFQTNGTGSFEDSTFVSREVVSGNAQGITEVVARSTLNPDGGMTVESFYMKGNKKVPGRTAHYVRDDNAVLVYNN